MDISAKLVLMTAIKITIVLFAMVALGMETTQQALLRLWRHPRGLPGALLAAFVVVPLVAYGLFRLLPLSYGAKVGLWAIAHYARRPDDLPRGDKARCRGNPGFSRQFSGHGGAAGHPAGPRLAGRLSAR